MNFLLGGMVTKCKREAEASRNLKSYGTFQKTCVMSCYWLVTPAWPLVGWADMTPDIVCRAESETCSDVSRAGRSVSGARHYNAMSSSHP